MLDVCLPGTGGMIPLPERWLACCWVEHQGKALLIDCGEGTQIALKKAGCRLSRLDVLLITHFHADHIAGLPGLLLTLGNNGKASLLTIVGPKGLKSVVSSLMIIAPALPYPVELIELGSGAEGTLEDNELEIAYLPLAHGIPCFGYRLSLRRLPVFSPAKADSLSVPKKHYRALHAGKSVVLDDGRRIEPDMVLDGERRPISVAYITDTVLTERMAAFVRDADLLVCEGMYGEPAMHDKMEEKGHMVFSDSARLASDAGVRRLWLTHFSPAMKDPENYVENARTIFEPSELGYDGIKISL
jgi:ribonuclease Z